MEPASPSFSSLASRWKPGADPGRTLVDDTRAAAHAMRPADLAAAAGLVASLDACLAAPESREPARRVLLAILDAARRRAFTSSMSPDDVEPWSRLLVP